MKLMNRRITLATLAVAATTLLGSHAMAQETITLRMHQMLPAQATIPSKALLPWAIARHQMEQLARQRYLAVVAVDRLVNDVIAGDGHGHGDHEARVYRLTSPT